MVTIIVSTKIVRTMLGTRRFTSSSSPLIHISLLVEVAGVKDS